MLHVPDRFQHAGALVATAALPKPLRVRARFALLSTLQRTKARRADVIFIVHPKAGGTWARVMMFRVYQQKYGLPPRRVVKSDELHNQNPSLPRFLISNGHYTYEGALKALYEDSSGTLEDKKHILFARHPCDVAVSWYLQFMKRTKEYKRELINAALSDPIDDESLTMWDFVMHRSLGLPGLIDFLNDWRQRLSVMRDGLIVRYEDFREEPVGALQRVMSFIGEDADRQRIEEAIAFASFDNLRKLEQQNYFRNPGLRLRDPDDPDTFKVRRGKVLGYRDYFSPQQIECMDTMVRERLHPVFGYAEAPAAPA